MLTALLYAGGWVLAGLILAGQVAILTRQARIEDEHAELWRALMEASEPNQEWQAGHRPTADGRDAAGHPPRKPTPLKPFEFVKGDWHGDPPCG